MSNRQGIILITSELISNRFSCASVHKYSLSPVPSGCLFLPLLQESTKDKSPEERAEALEADDDICKSHDAVAREGQTAVRKEKIEKVVSPLTKYKCTSAR